MLIEQIQITENGLVITVVATHPTTTKRRPSSRHDTDAPMPMPRGATMLVSGACDGQSYDGGPALAALASAWEEKVRSWVYGICVTWI